MNLSDFEYLNINRSIEYERGKMEQVKAVIKKAIEDIQIQNSFERIYPDDDLEVVKDLGFESLDIAQLIGTLDMELGIEPFSQGASVENVLTVGDVCQLYATYMSA